MLSQLINTARQDTATLDAIRLDGGTQPRAGINNDYVNELVEALQTGATLPPVDVIYDGETYWLYDGFHRVAAHRKADYRIIPVNIHQGTQADAQWRSYAANQTHGLRRSNEDKQRAIKAALRHTNGAQMPNREIARHLGVDEKTVRLWREKLESSAEIPQTTERTVTRDGVQYTQNTTNIGATQRPSQSAISNQQSPINNSPSPAPRPSPLAPSPYKSLAQMDADGDLVAFAPRPAQPDTYTSVHPLQTALRSLTATYTAADLRTTATYRGGSRWFEARRLLAAADIHYRDRDLVQALNNLADELEQRDRAQPAQPSTPSISSTPAPEPDDRINLARILINHYQDLRAACEDILQREREYEALVGTPSDLLAAHRGMHAIVDTLPEPIAKLQHLVETLITTRYESR